MKTAKELVTEWFDRVWNQRDRAAIEELMCEDCTIHGLNLSEKGPSAFESFHSAYCSAFEQIHIDIMEMAEEGNLVIGHARFAAIHRETQKDLSFLFSFSAYYRDGQLAEARNVVDFLSMLDQLEMLDGSLMEQALRINE